MRITELRQSIQLLNEHQQKQWQNRFIQSMKVDFHCPQKVSFEDFLLAVYGAIHRISLSVPVIAYGAGNIGQKYIPQVASRTTVLEIWDKNSSLQNIRGIPIVKPHGREELLSSPIVIFIDSITIVLDVTSELQEKGYRDIFSYIEYDRLLCAVEKFDCLESFVTEQTATLWDLFLEQFERIGGKAVPVNYSVVPKHIKDNRLSVEQSQETMRMLDARLREVLKISGERSEKICGAVTDFGSVTIENQLDFCIQFENYLRSVLQGGTKTRERPIRMQGDIPYDQFAVYETIKETLLCICKDHAVISTVLSLLRMLYPESVPLMSAECYFHLQTQRYEDALTLSRTAIHKEPNSLLANETFYQVALRCKEKGIAVKEPLPEYDLSERYCWSGLTFALCAGFNADGTADFLPCFRTLQCAAHPKGSFWSSEEWIEFRKSILDGSFRYCQKNQCTNIIAGWLPKKSECSHTVINELIHGNENKIPCLEELHFSYDSHCNLQCPSCRLKIQTLSPERVDSMDSLFEKNMRPLLANAKHLCLSGCGEAIISPHSKKILQSLSAEKYPELAVELRTNVFSFTPANWDALGSGRQVIKHVAASIDAASRELFEKLRFPAKWDVVLKNLRFLQSLRNENAIELLEFHVVVQIDNMEELMDIINMALEYDADAITFSKMVNWRNIPEREYFHLNPFWTDHPKHDRLLEIVDDIIKFRDTMERGAGETDFSKSMYINMHSIPDPSSCYDIIRTGRLKIR